MERIPIGTEIKFTRDLIYNEDLLSPDKFILQNKDDIGKIIGWCGNGDYITESNTRSIIRVDPSEIEVISDGKI